MGPQGHSGSSLKNNTLPGGAPETARDLKAKEQRERKDTDIYRPREEEKGSSLVRKQGFISMHFKASPQKQSNNG